MIQTGHHKKPGLFVRNMIYRPQQQGGSNEDAGESAQSGVSGGKNSDTGKRIFLNESQGSSVLHEHSFVGIQKS